jgi:hypothetical protein
MGRNIAKENRLRVGPVKKEPSEGRLDISFQEKS